MAAVRRRLGYRPVSLSAYSYLRAIGRGRDVRTERALLRYASDDLRVTRLLTTTVCGVNEEQTYPYFPSGEKIRHAWSVRHRNPQLFAERTRIENVRMKLQPRTVTQTSEPSGHKECLVRRTPDVRDALDGIALRVDERNRVRSDGDDR